jgi:cell division septation protein DedD
MNVNWDDAKQYVRWLSRRTGRDYRLPSEAEWEYAARAGTTTAFHFGDRISPSQVNYNSNYSYNGGAKGRYRKRTVAVGSFPANAFGLHDVHGNIFEWVEDCWNGSYGGAPSDGNAWTTGDCSRRVLRGGSWLGKPRHLRAAQRFKITTGYSSSSVGFRVARTLEPSSPSEKPPKRIARAAPSPPPSPPGAPVANGYRAQVATAKREADANRKVAQLRKDYADLFGPLPLRVRRVDLGAKGVWYRVQAGAFAEMGQATQLCEELKRRGEKGCWVVR